MSDTEFSIKTAASVSKCITTPTAMIFVTDSVFSTADLSLGVKGNLVKTGRLYIQQE